MNKRLYLTAALTLAAGCSGQLPGGASYRLVAASNNPLPILLRIDDCEHKLYGSKVVFDGKGRYRSSYDIRKTCGGSTSAVPDPGVAGEFTLRNDTAFFSDGAGNAAGFGVLSSDSLVVNGILHHLVYVRERD